MSSQYQLCNDLIAIPVHEGRRDFNRNSLVHHIVKFILKFGVERDPERPGAVTDRDGDILGLNTWAEEGQGCRDDFVFEDSAQSPSSVLFD